MKATASGLLLAAAVLYLTTLQLHGTAIGFVRAGAEAAMVGGLADWFAVTALFRRPLGLPLPHTGLIPRQKDDIAVRLGAFVTDQFVTAEAVVEQLAKADLVPRLARQLADPEVSARVGAEVAFNLGVLLRHLPDDDVVAAVHELLRRDLARRSYAPVLGQLLDRAVEGQVQRPLVDLLAGTGARYLSRNGESLLPEVRAFVDSQSWLASVLVTDRRIRKVLRGVAGLLTEVERSPEHPLRQWTDGLLRQLALGLRHDPGTAAELDALLAQLLEEPQAQAALRDLVLDTLESVRLSLSDADAVLKARVTGFVRALGERLTHDAALQERVESTVATVAAHLVENYGDQLTHLIQAQVAKLDAVKASRLIELEIGRDLQFIRLNGTAVGALAGLAIHGVTLAVS